MSSVYWKTVKVLIKQCVLLKFNLTLDHILQYFSVVPPESCVICKGLSLVYQTGRSITGTSFGLFYPLKTGEVKFGYGLAPVGVRLFILSIYVEELLSSLLPERQLLAIVTAGGLYPLARPHFRIILRPIFIQIWFILLCLVLIFYL